MKAKDRHRDTLIEYIANWDNDFPTRTKMAEVLGMGKHSLWAHFTPAELTEIEDKGLELRKKRSARPRTEVYKDLLKAAKAGKVPAMKEFLDRTEGAVATKNELTGKDGQSLFPELSDDELDARIKALMKKK